jgi:DNA-binding NtrC family response regulator
MSHTILLVEDDFEMRRLLSRALRRDDYTLVEASNGYEFLDWLSPAALRGEFPWVPDLVISDIRLPFFSAIEVLEGCKDMAKRVPLILITGFPDDETRARAKELGAFCLLEKPLDVDDLRAAVRRALASHANYVEEATLTATA